MNIIKRTDITDTSTSKLIFESIANDIYSKGFSIKPLAVPPELALRLQIQANSLEQSEFNRAGIGREQSLTLNQFIRTDSIYWIEGNTSVESDWLDWINSLKMTLNRKLMLGLFSFESHFARYKKGQFYKRHYDSFRGDSNRILSVVVYLNDDWQHHDGGELVIYNTDQDSVGTRILPRMATLVAFLSEEFPHEVLPSNRDRLSIAGWFRINQSNAHRIDPPT